MHEPTHLDLFSGIGGFSIAAQWAGFKTIGFCECAEYPRRIIAQRFPGVTIYPDIRTLPAIPCTLITGGFPCTPFSIAGRRQGESDDRYLWPAMLSAIKRCQPDWVLGENVVNIANMVLPRCLDDLAECGYIAKALDIPACAVGLPTMERHIWIIAARDVLRVEGHASRNREEWACVHERDDWCSAFELKRRNLPEGGLRRSRKGIPRYVERITAIGNAIPPPVAYEILKEIRKLI